MAHTNDDVMYALLDAKREGCKIFYTTGGLDKKLLVEPNHKWNLVDNTYTIQRRREYIIHVDKNGQPHILHTTNEWTRSDFGLNSDGSEEILMREVYQEEM